ncbi:MAG: VIT1/CCC1 family protein [Rickettsiales bacterium]|nr:VIT1/CCC1 family protein [Rickettsiales bacterium]
MADKQGFTNDMKLRAAMLSYQKAETTAAVLYGKIARGEKDGKNRAVLESIAAEEKSHAAVWERYTGRKVRPNYIKIYWYLFLNKVLGYTFVARLLEEDEYDDIMAMLPMQGEIPEVKSIIEQERGHENLLMGMLDEERLKYVGAVLLGLNDALVELTGTIAGLTFALMDNRLVMLAGIITGVSATLSMAASNYLAERADGNPHALKASLYTGIAYLATVVLLVLPYAAFPSDRALAALSSMMLIVVLIIFSFNYYISVAKSLPFMKRFLEMAAISLGVAAIAFAIGLAAKRFLGIDL